jgi:hypothetical protein
MKRVAAAVLLLGVLLACASQQAAAGSFDLGVGLGFADSSGNGAFEGGWDLQVGYERKMLDDWNVGAQLHWLKGWTDKSKTMVDTDMYFQSTALYVIARPDDWWLQFSGGVVSADYKSQTMAGSGTGLAVGAGIVLGGESLRLHLLDVRRYMIAGQGFNIYSISLVFFLFH